MDSTVPSVAEVHGILLALQKNLECPICLEVMKEPVSTTNCAHNFCRFCILKLLSQKKGLTQCPLCNAKVAKRSLGENVRFKEIIKVILEMISAFEHDTGFKFSDDQCYPKRANETFSASSQWREQLPVIVDSKGYRNRLKCMKKEEKRNTDLGESSNLPQYNGTVKRYFLRKKNSSDETVVFETGSDSSEDSFQKTKTIRCMDIGSASPSQVDQGYNLNPNQSPCFIELLEPSTKSGASLNILGICESFEGRKPEDTEDTCPVTENVEILEKNMTAKKTQNMPLLDSCLEKSHINQNCHYIKDHSSSTLGRLAQVQSVDEIIKMATNEQADNGTEKAVTVQVARNTPCVCENREQQLQSQMIPDSSLSQISGKTLMQSVQKVNEWFSKSKEIPSPSSVQDVSSEELDQAASSNLPALDFCDFQKTDQIENQRRFTKMHASGRLLFKTAASEIVDKIFGKTYKRERKSISPGNEKETTQIQAEEIVALNTPSCNTFMRKMLTRKRKATSKNAPMNINKRQNVKRSNKKSVGEEDVSVFVDNDQAFIIVDRPIADQMEADFSETLPKEGMPVKADERMQAQSECHTLPELNLKQLETDTEEPRKVSPDQIQVRWSRRLQLLTGDRKQSESMKRKRKVDERDQKQELSVAKNIPPSFIVEGGSCELEGTLEKSDTNPIDKSYLCDREKANPNQANSPNIMEIEKSLVNVEQTTKGNSSCADSQGIHPAVMKEAASEEDQFRVTCQPEKHAGYSQIIQGDAVCPENVTENVKIPETNSKVTETLELNPETDDSDLDASFMQNIFDCCKRQSFLLHPSPVKELVVDVQRDLSTCELKDDKVDFWRKSTKNTNGVCEEIKEVNKKGIFAQALTSFTSDFPEHKTRTESLQVASQDPSPHCPSIPMQAIVRSGEEQCPPESKKPMVKERASSGIEGVLESPDGRNRNLSVWRNNNLQEISLNHINKISSSTVRFQDAESKSTENKRLELSPQTELMQEDSLTCLSPLPGSGCIHVENKRNPMEPKEMNSDTEEGINISRSDVIKSQFPQNNLEFCSEEKSLQSQQLSVTPDNLLDPSVKNKEDPPDFRDIKRNVILAVPDEKDKQTTNERDLESRSQCSLRLQNQDFVLTRRRSAQKLPSSEEEDSSEDENLPSFQALIFDKYPVTLPQPLVEKETPAEMLSLKNSRSCLKHEDEDICQSQESEGSVNLFSSQSSVSVDSSKPCNLTPLSLQLNSREKLPDSSGNEKASLPNNKEFRDIGQLNCGQEECTNSESNLGEEMMSCACEATQLEDSLDPSSQSEILTTQQRDAIQNNLKKLQQKMAMIEAVLKQGSQSSAPEGWLLQGKETDLTREQAETANETHTVWKKPVSPLKVTSYCSTKKKNTTSPLLTSKNKMFLVASGLNQSELRLVQRFTRKTDSTWSHKITEETTHVVIKTDEDLVCERTLKYFLGIAAQKWVLSYQWILQSLQARRVLKEEDFEVRGDVINGRCHQGPKRAREASAGKLFQGLEICCYGPFTDMLLEQLEWIVELCGASLVKEPHLFAHLTNSAAVLVVQPDAWTEDNTCQELALQCNMIIVSREWVLDSVACYQRQPFEDYIIQQV